MRKRRHADIALSLTSFGDIAFLMIIFFMLVSNFMKKATWRSRRRQQQSREAGTPGERPMDADGAIWYEATSAARRSWRGC